MTLTHHSQILAVLIGTAFLSCAGSDAREDNEAPPAFQPRSAAVQPAESPAPPTYEVRRWREPQQGTFAVSRTHGLPATFVLRSQDRSLDHQSGPLLGVSVERSNDGLRVTEIKETSVAGSAGVKSGDVLLRVGDEHIDTVGDVRHALAGKRPGDQVKVAVIRAGEGIVELTGTVPEPPAGAGQAEEAEAANQARERDPLHADGSQGGFLGVQLRDEEELSTTDGAAPGAQAAPQPDAGPGVVIEDVVPNSAAWFAGLEAQDRLLSIDGQAVKTRADVVGAVASKEPGTLVELKYQRAGEEHSARVRLGPRPMRGLLGSLPDFGPRGLGGQQLGDLLDLHGSQLDPGRMGRMRFELPDMSRLMDQPGAEHSVRVEIEGDRMTVERDGQTEHYMRGPDGNWVSEEAPSTDGSRA
jgi:membrane-associated protease RseP (regulator of RpoE activity)